MLETSKLRHNSLPSHSDQSVITFMEDPTLPGETLKSHPY